MKIRSFVSVFTLVGLASLTAACASDREDAESREDDATARKKLSMASGWMTPSFPEDSSIEDVAIARPLDASRPAYVYAVSRAEGGYDTDPRGSRRVIVSRSSDGGKTFATVATLDGVARRARLTIAPSDDRTVYLSAGGYGDGLGLVEGTIHVSTDGGEHFIAASAKAPVTSLDVNPSNPAHLVGAACNGVYRSLDSGATFTRLGNSPDLSDRCNYATLHRGVNDRDTMYVSYGVGEGGSYEIFRTDNGAGTWKRIDGKTPSGSTIGFSLDGFMVHPNDAKRVYVFDGVLGWHSSADGGEHWFPHNIGLGVTPGDWASYGSASVSNVVFDTFTGADPHLYVADQGALKRWTPTNAKENGHWAPALASAKSPFTRLIAGSIAIDGDGTPRPVLIGITPIELHVPARLQVAHLRVSR